MTEETAFSDEAPRRPDSAVQDALEQPALEPSGEVVFLDQASGSPLAPEASPTPAPPNVPVPSATTKAELGVLGRIAFPAQTRDGPAVATAPCPSCAKPVPLEHARCTFCGKPLVKKVASPFDGVATLPGSPLSLATPSERPTGPTYVPESLARELAVRDDLLSAERALARDASRAKRRWLLRWAPLVIANAWLLIWILAVGSSVTAVVLYAVDLLAAWAIVRWSLSRGGGSSPTVMATSLWVFVKIGIAAAKLGIFFVALALIPGLMSLGMAALVGIAIELEADELRAR